MAHGIPSARRGPQVSRVVRGNFAFGRGQVEATTTAGAVVGVGRIRLGIWLRLVGMELPYGDGAGRIWGSLT